MWITGTPMWIRHVRLFDSRLPTTSPHLTHISVTRRLPTSPTASTDAADYPLAHPIMLSEYTANRTYVLHGYARSLNKEPRFRIGDHVQVRWRGQEGTIIDINGSLYMVLMNDGRTVESYKESQLKKVW